MSERKGDWFQTFSWRKFYPLDPRIEDLDIFDIAHALSLLCRFNGHCKSHYSVGQHSVLVSAVIEAGARIAKKEHPEVSEREILDLAMCGLLHDAAEAYLGDMIRPLKRSMPTYCEAETALERLVAQRWALEFPWPDSIKGADNVLLMTERRDLLLKTEHRWTDRATPLADRIEPWTAQDAELRFLQRFEKLEYARAQAAL